MKKILKKINNMSGLEKFKIWFILLPTPKEEKENY